MKNALESRCEPKVISRTEATKKQSNRGSKSISLTDVPLEVRRSEASKLLYLERYE
jgi:hypothetical protein